MWRQATYAVRHANAARRRFSPPIQTSSPSAAWRGRVRGIVASVAPRKYATIGRAADNDVVIDDPTVSNHHARLSWAGTTLLVEDLSSANGTFVDGQQVTRIRTRPGAELRVGQVTLSWSHEGLRGLLKSGVGARTLVMPKASSPSYLCGACGHVGALPPGPSPSQLKCGACGTTLRTGKARKGDNLIAGVVAALIIAAGVGAARYTWQTREVPRPLIKAVTEVQETLQLPVMNEHVGSKTAEQIAKAFTPTDALTRNTAVKIAARNQGPFHVEQVAEIWSSVRKAWRYVNDPEGQEYFATATETIENGYVGDCDDFAIALASMVSAIGGKSRVVLMDGPRGGHAYAEACVQGEPTEVATALSKLYRKRWRSYIQGPIPTTIAYRSSESCPIWLNLDWNSWVPGGAYEPETWAVAIYADAEREPLSPANPAPKEETGGEKKNAARAAHDAPR